MNTLHKKRYIALMALLTGLSSTAMAEDEAPKRAQTVTDILERPGVLTPKGTFVIDGSFSYTQNSSNSVSVVGYTVLPSLIVGLIRASDIDRTTMTLGLTGRYGITNRLEAEVRIPWVYRTDSISERELNSGSNQATLRNVDGNDLGDIEAALKYQFNLDSPPYWIGSLRFKSTTGKSPYEIDVNELQDFEELPTGSGFMSIEPGVTMIMPIDPAVIFLSLSYIWNIEDDVSVNITSTDGASQIQANEIDLGDTIAFSAGMGFAINPKLSFNLGLSHKTILKSKVDGSTPDDAKLLQLDSLTVGANYAINPSASLGISAAAGLTADAPDFQLTVRMPYSFNNLFK